MENKIIDNVLKEFANNFRAIEYSKNKYALTTPFFYHSGNPMMVAIIIVSENEFVLTDQKSTFNEYKIEKLNSVIETKIKSYADKYDVKLVDDEFCIKTSLSEILGAYDCFIHTLILTDNLLSENFE